MHARGVPIVCLVNTTTGREREYAIRPARRPRSGWSSSAAGPPGLESRARARAARPRRHRLRARRRARRAAAAEPPGAGPRGTRRAPALAGRRGRSAPACASNSAWRPPPTMALAEHPDLDRRRDRRGARPAARFPASWTARSSIPTRILRRPVGGIGARAGDRWRHPRRGRRAGAGRKERRRRPGRSRPGSWPSTSRAAPAASRRLRCASGPTSRYTSARPSRRWANAPPSCGTASADGSARTSISSSPRARCCR